MHADVSTRTRRRSDVEEEDQYHDHHRACTHRSSNEDEDEAAAEEEEEEGGGGGGGEEPTLHATSADHEFPTTLCEQFHILSTRAWRATSRDSAQIVIRPLAALAIALLVGAVFFQQPDTKSSSTNRTNALLFVMCVFSLFGVPAISKFIEERVLFTREHASGSYRTLAFYLASFAVEFPVLLAIVAGYGTISYWMVGLQPDAIHFGFFLSTIFMVINVGFALSQLISAAVSSVNMAIAVYMIVLVYSLLLGGFMIPPSALPAGIRWIFWTSYFYYGFQALFVNEYELKAYGEEVMSDLGMLGADKYLDLMGLCLLFLLFRTAAYVLLRFAHKESR